MDGRTVVLTVKETVNDRQVIMELSGKLLSETELPFRDELTALATVGADIILDCAGLEGISNACQLALLSTQQQMDTLKKGTLTLRNVPPAIYKDFEHINFHELLMIE